MTFVRERPAQSTLARRHLPAARAARFLLFTGVVAWLAGSPAYAQQAAVVSTDQAPFFGDIGGTRLGRLNAGARVETRTRRSGHTEITLEGWVFRPSLQSTTRDGHTLAVSRSPTENLRDGPNGRVVAQMVQGFLLDSLERQGRWVHVRRTVWVASSALRSGTGGVAANPAARDTTRRTPAADRTGAASAPDSTADPRRGIVRRRMQLFSAPDSSAIGQLEAGTPVRISARANGWVRVEAQAWVRESEIRPSDNAILTGVSAAELRNAPDEFRGRLLRWTIQFLALQTADELRPDFTPGQRYILARGPAPEYAFCYVVVPDSLLEPVQHLQPLAPVTIIARVVSGRSTFLGNPILELLELP